MAGERKSIRDSVKEILQTVYAGKIYTSRKIDVRDDLEYVNVFFESGDTEYEGLRSSTSCELVVSYNNSNQFTDDELDAVADMLNQALVDNDVAPGVIRGMLPAGFAYESDQESAFTGINLLYTVYY